MESDEAFGSFMNPSWKGGKSPVRSASISNPSVNQFHAPHPPTAIQPVHDPRIPFGYNNPDATSPVRVAIQPGYSPRDPRVQQYTPYGYSSVAPVPFQAGVPQYITHPIQYSQLSPEYQPHPYVYAGIQPAALPPLPYVSPRRQQASRSQPASRRRRSSLSSMSSDSDDAEEISARIMAASSEDPRELRSIIKSSRGRQNKSLLRHRTDGSPKVRVDKDSFSRDRSVPSMLDEFSDVFRTDGSPYGSIYKSRRKPERRDHKSRRERLSREPRRPPRRSRTISVDEDDMQIPAAVDAETWFNPEQSPEREDEPAAVPPPPSKKQSSKQSSTSDRRRRRSVSEQPPRRRQAQQLTTTVAHAAAIVPVDPERPKPRNLNGSKRPTQKDQIGEKVQTWWNPASIVTGKRQRLPVLDWRKGERYNRAPDGTVIGKEGFAKLVFDDNLGKKKGRRRESYTRLSEEPTTAASEDEYRKKEKKRSRRRSSEPSQAPIVIDDEPPRIAVPESMLPNNNTSETTNQRPLLNGWDYMHKNQDGVYCLDKFQIIHRREDRKWSEENTEGGFIMSPSINCDSGFVAEMCLLPGMPTAPMETLGEDQALFLQVLRAAPNSIRIQVNGSEERLSPDDIMFIDCGSSYSITNVSRDQRAVLSFAYVQNKD